ncbi:MAG: carbohydrate porin [Gallionellaceae bacterium]
MIIKKISAVLAALMMSPLAVLAADECPNWKESALTGDWGGTRSTLCEKGVTVELTHKSDLLSNFSGGVSQGSAWLMNSEIAVGMDLNKLAGLEGASAFIQYHAQHGDLSINERTGSFAGVSNIETGVNTSLFYQAWLQQNLANDSLSLLAGLYAVDSEFYVTDTSGLFLQPPYGMSAEMAQSGRNGPPVFPMGALGVRVKYSAADLYVQVALTDGVPGDPNNANGTHIRLDKGDGTLAVAEFGLTPQGAEGAIAKAAIGLWHYTTRAVAEEIVDANGMPLYGPDQGAYIIAERTLMAEQGNPGQGLAGFARFGVVNKDLYQADWSGSLGLNYQGPLEGRDDDAVGIAVANIHASSKYQLLNSSDSSETVVELTYRAQVQPWLAVQPSVQYISNPSMDPALKDAVVAGVRIEAGL